MFSPQPEPDGGAFSLGGTGRHQINECRRALSALQGALDRCADEDVREECEPALIYLEEQCYKPGPVRRFRSALSVYDPMQRWRLCRLLIPEIARQIPGHFQTKE